VGGVGDVSASLFDGIDYTALGHLHGAQVLRPGLRYSGSPMAYSFSEALTSRARGWSSSTPPGSAPSSSSRPRCRAGCRRCAASWPPADRPALAAQEDDYLSVVLTDAVRPGGPDGPGCAAGSRTCWSWTGSPRARSPTSAATAPGGRPRRPRVVTEFVRHVRGGGSTSDAGAADEQDRALLAQALEAGRLAAASA
jgi:exonuclease SbcD